ncbi:hypothetical protein PoMZ_10251 [Pyricularia oryzae]|uniref:Uncharacterized protein n=2 Tax=Pyricularia oryzae TaxID=318829 RepID=A0A4P7MZG6_PYROR|nr:hypothetical protein PoMZ_10251 [Pyricularia oryzae]
MAIEGLSPLSHALLLVNLTLAGTLPEHNVQCYSCSTRPRSPSPTR